jgi:hypothetical protein
MRLSGLPEKAPGHRKEADSSGAFLSAEKRGSDLNFVR